MPTHRESSKINDLSLESELYKYFGFSTFREPQREIIATLLSERNVLAVMPTGAGKSLCYQLPACLLPGITLVVSPLIALMKDQVDSLCAHGISAAFLNSSQSFREQRATLDTVRSGSMKVLFVAPERFNNGDFISAITHREVSLLAVDEAHCISQWGHNFRPDYRKIGEFRASLGDPLTIALTATATPTVQVDILQQLRLTNGRRFVSGFKRPNLFFEVIACNDDQKFQTIHRELAKSPHSPSVIYCATRREVEEVRNRLNHRGFLVAAYHAGLTDREREEIQDAWMANDVHTLVATNAFGMGVDKKDVRTVIHYKLSGSLEAYYQEAGRAGRDGNPSRCILLYERNDESIQKFFMRSSFPQEDVILRTWKALRKGKTKSQSLQIKSLTAKVNLLGEKKTSTIHMTEVDTALRYLEEGGHILIERSGDNLDIEVKDAVKGADLRIDWETLNMRREVMQRQIWDMTKYVNSKDCRQNSFIHHFNDDETAYQCNYCDNCYAKIKKKPPRQQRAARSFSALFEKDDKNEVVQKLLCGVVRAHGTGGLIAVAAMLRGSTSILVKRLQFDQLSTYGLFSDLHAHEIVTMLKVLMLHGFIERQGSNITITKSGYEIAAGREFTPQALINQLEKLVFQ